MTRRRSAALTTCIATLLLIVSGGGCGDADEPQPSCSESRACVEGAAFVSCPETAQAPALFCSSGDAGRCVWVSDGCPFGDYVHRIGADCACSDAACPPPGTIASFTYHRGSEPWTRAEPTLALSVAIDGGVNASGGSSTQCQGGPSGLTDCARASLCCTETTGPGAGPLAHKTSKTLRDTISLRFSTLGVFAGWELEIEVDHSASPPRARACRIPTTDTPRCGDVGAERECATSGELILSDGAPTTTNLESLRGSYNLSFPSGLKMQGAF